MPGAAPGVRCTLAQMWQHAPGGCLPLDARWGAGAAGWARAGTADAAPTWRRAARAAARLRSAAGGGPGSRGGARLLSRAARAGSFTSGLSQLVEKMRYTLYGKHRRTTFDASACARALPSRPAPCGRSGAQRLPTTCRRVSGSRASEARVDLCSVFWQHCSGLASGERAV